MVSRPKASMSHLKGSLSPGLRVWGPAIDQFQWDWKAYPKAQNSPKPCMVWSLGPKASYFESLEP